MGRASEAGYSLEPEDQSSQSGYGGGSENNDMQRPSYVNTDTQFQLHTQPQSPTSNSQHPSSTSSTIKPWKRFAIPTKTSSLSSGFPFHPHLYTLAVSHDQWHLFTSSLVSAAKMTATEDYLAWTTGISAGLLSSPFLVFFAPVAGYYSGKAVHKKTLVRTVKEKMREEGGLRQVLREWNSVFAGKGFQAWLEVPRVSGELHGGDGGEGTVEMDAKASENSSIAGKTSKTDEKKRRKVEKKAGKRFRLILVPIGEVDQNTSHSGLVFGSTESESGSMLGTPNAGTNERGVPVSEMPALQTHDSHSHRETMPPAYWDANAVEAYNDVGGNAQAQVGLGQYQGQQVIHDEEGVSPIVREQLQQQLVQTPAEIRGAPLERKIRYTRLEGYTNA